MNLRPKTKRRLMVLLLGAALCSSAALAVVEIQLYRHRLIRQGYRDKAMVYYLRGDYPAAMAGLRKYLSQNSSDGPAIYAYAVSRSEVPEPDLKHLVKAKSIFARYLEINPSDVQAQHKLLEIYRRIRYDAEAQLLAQSLLNQNPDDVEALQAKLQAMIDQAQYEPALAVSLKVNELAPMDLEAQMTTYRLMAQLKRPAAVMVNRAEKMLLDYPNNPRFELLRAVAAGFDGDEKGVQHWLMQAASRTSPDAQFTRELSNLFERIGMFDQARALLAQSLDQSSADPEMLAELVQEQWEAGQVSAALDRLVHLDTDPKTDAHLLGLKALLLYSRGTDSDRVSADGIRLALAKRDGENVASAWNSLLRSRFLLPPVDPRQAVALCQAALHRDPENPVGRYFLGLSYNDLGETELALQCWRLASKLAPSWAAPHLCKAQTLLDRGRSEQAYAEAQAAAACSENSLDEAVALALTEYAKLGAFPSSEHIDSLLASFETIQHQHPDEPRTLANYVALLGRRGRTREALGVSRSALLAEPALPPRTLLELARVSSAQHLGVEPDIADLFEQLKPATPQTLYDRAIILAMLGERADGLKSLTAARARAGSDAMQWQLALIQYRQTIADGNLAGDWASLGDANPKNLIVQRAIIEASSAWSDRHLIDRTIDRIRTLTGDECITWRLARARWQLASNEDTRANASAAAVMMADVVRIAADLPEPQLLWATALERLGDYAGAIDRLRTAMALAPGDLDISLRLADQLQLQGKDDEARDILEKLSQNDGITPAGQLQIARVLWRSGQSDAAFRVLDSAAAKAAQPDRDLLLAQIDQSQGKVDQAARIYDELIKSPTPPDAVVQAVAWFDAWRGDVPGGLRVLDRLSDARELTLAAFDESFGSPDAAMGHYRAAVAALPSDIASWKALAGFQLRRGKFDDTISTAVTGLQAVPGDRDLIAIKLRAQTLATLPPSPALQLLINALSTHPADEPAVQTLNAISPEQLDPTALDKSHPQLRAVADANPRFLPAQMLLAEEYFSTGRMKEAEEVSMRAMQASPAEAEPARVMTIVWSSVGQWNKALAAAYEWRKRTLDRPLNADLKIAETKLHLNDPSGALARLVPYLDRAKASPNQNVDVIRLYATALAQDGKMSEAEALMDPLLSQAPRWRTMWLDLVASTARDAASAEKGIDKITALTSAGDDDRLVAARAWFNAGQRLNDNFLLERGRAILLMLVEDPNSSSAQWLMLGSIAMRLDDLATAESNFRKAIQMDATNWAARNNLAYTILLRGGDLSEAKRLVRDAIAQAPMNSSFHNTLACIDEKTGNLGAALSGFGEAIEMDATNVDAIVGLADLQLQTGRREEAATTLEQIDLLPGTVPISDSLRKRLGALRIALRKTPQTTSMTDVK